MRLGFLLLALLVATLLALAVTGALPEDDSDAAPRPWSRPLEERAADPFPRFYRSTNGNVVSIAQPPQRIVAGSVLSAEVLLSICPPERIAAIHETAVDPRYCAIAEEVAAFPRHTGPDPEEIISYRPDLVITDSFTWAGTQTLLEEAGVTVVRTGMFRTLDDLEDNMRGIGYVTGLDEEVEELIRGMREQFARLASGADARRGWRVLDLNAAMYSSGRGSTLDGILAHVGARNVAAENGVGEYLRVDIEQVLGWDPDVLIVPVVLGEEEKERRRIRQDPGLRVLRCVQQDRIMFVSGALLGSTSHYVAEAGRVIAEQLDRWGSR